MSDETCSAICKALVVGAALYVTYEITQFRMIQANLDYASYMAKESLMDSTARLTISLDHLLAEQIA